MGPRGARPLCLYGHEGEEAEGGQLIAVTFPRTVGAPCSEIGA